MDISKYFHVAMIHNGLGEIVIQPFEVDIYQSGFDQLCQAIDQAKAHTQAQVVLVGMEPTSHYFENLARHLLERSQPVKLINSFSVKQNREQQLMRREKSDQIDVAAIGDLLRRGEGTPYQPAKRHLLAASATRPGASGQSQDRQACSRTRSSAIWTASSRVWCCWMRQPRNATRPLFNVDFWKCQTLQDLIRVCPNPNELVKLLAHSTGTGLSCPRMPSGACHSRQNHRPGPQNAPARPGIGRHSLRIAAT